MEEASGLMDQQTFDDSETGAVLFEAGAMEDDSFDVSTTEDPFADTTDTDIYTGDAEEPAIDDAIYGLSLIHI